MADGSGDDVAKVPRRLRLSATSADLAFAKIPNEMIINSGLSPVALKLLAYRMTKVGNFVLHHVDVKRRIGMSKDAFYASLNELMVAGLIERQPAFGRRRTTERLLVGVPDPHESGYVWVWMKHIRLLPTAALAVYMLLQAHWPKQKLFAREVQEHWGWSDKTTQKWLTYLIHQGLAGESRRRKKGCFNGSVYEPADVSRDEIATWLLRPGTPQRTKPEANFPDTISGHVNPPEPKKADGNSATSYKGSPLVTEDCPLYTTPLPVASPLRGSRRGRQGAPAGVNESEEDGGVERWLEDLIAFAEKKHDLWSPPMNDEDALNDARDELDDETLRLDLSRATDGRVGRVLLAAAGLEGYRRIVVGCAEIANVTFVDAHDYLCDLIEKRIGADEERSLNSWKWLCKSLVRRVGEPGDIPCSEEAVEDDDHNPEIPF